MGEKINLLILNDIGRNILRYLQKNLGTLLDKKVTVSKHFVVPDYIFNTEKNKYDGKKLLGFLAENLTLKEAKDINLAIFDRDLFAGHLDIVFGLASPFPQICLISIIRLHPHYEKDYFQEGLKKRKMGRFPLAVRRLTGSERTDYYERILKESVHGIGHTLGFLHCDNASCIMHPSDALEDIDNKKIKFCSSCTSSIS